MIAFILSLLLVSFNTSELPTLVLMFFPRPVQVHSIPYLQVNNFDTARLVWFSGVFPPIVFI